MLIRIERRSWVIGWLKTSVLLATACTNLSWSAADEIMLKDGRKIVGTVRNKDKDKPLVVELSPGSLVLINQADIKSHAQNAEAEQAYIESMNEEKDTVEFHLMKAGQCTKGRLNDQAKAHYERVLELDTDNATARGTLGFVRNKSDGRWVSRDELMTEGRGKVQTGGNRYRFPELIQMQEAEEKIKNDRVLLANEIKKALNNLNNPRTGLKAQAVLDNLEGPLASAAIADAIYPRPGAVSKGARAQVKLMFIPILEKLADGGAVQTLIRFSLDRDPSPENVQVRQQSIEVLKRIAPDAALAAFLGALGAKDAVDINNAAAALELLGDPRATLPLIDRVLTYTATTVGSTATNAGMSNGDVSFSPPSKPKIVNVPTENAAVRSALMSLTSQDFAYDRNSWLRWYNQQFIEHSGDLRRDQ